MGMQASVNPFTGTPSAGTPAGASSGSRGSDTSRGVPPGSATMNIPHLLALRHNMAVMQTLGRRLNVVSGRHMKGFQSSYTHRETTGVPTGGFPAQMPEQRLEALTFHRLSQRLMAWVSILSLSIISNEAWLLCSSRGGSTPTESATQTPGENLISQRSLSESLCIAAELARYCAVPQREFYIQTAFPQRLRQLQSSSLGGG